MVLLVLLLLLVQLFVLLQSLQRQQAQQQGVAWSSGSLGVQRVGVLEHVLWYLLVLVLALSPP